MEHQPQLTDEQLPKETACDSHSCQIDIGPLQRQLNDHCHSNRHIKDFSDHKFAGIKSKKFKLLEHPLEHLERTILISLTLSIVFTLLALISGLPIVLLLFVLSLPILLIKHTIYSCANIIFRTKIYHKSLLFDCCSSGTSNNNRNSVSGNSSHHYSDWKYCPLNYLESYWFKPELVNQCFLFTEQNVTLNELRQLIRDSILREPEFRKFKSRIVTKRFVFSSLYWECLSELDLGGDSRVIDDDPTTTPSDTSNKFSLDDHIIQDEPIGSRRSLRKRNTHLLNVPLPANKPLWQIRLAAVTYADQCVIIVRCHQVTSVNQCFQSIHL